MKYRLSLLMLLGFPMAGSLPVAGNESASFARPYNENPRDCSNCITITVEGQDQPDKPGAEENSFSSDSDGNFQIAVEVKKGTGAGCANVSISKVELVAGDYRREIDPESEEPHVIEGDLVAEHGPDWKVVVVCSGDADGDLSYGLPSGAVPGLEYSFKLAESCGSCTDASCPPDAENGSFSYNLSLGGADGGDSRGSLKFFAPDFANPGTGGLYAQVPGSYTVTRDGSGRITGIGGGANSIEVTHSSTLSDSNAFTVTHKDAGGTPFRVTVIGMVNEGGVTRFRADSTFAGATYRHEQTQPEVGTLVLESGRIEGGNFVGLKRETHTVQSPEAGIKVNRDKIEERATAGGTYEVVSDVTSRWYKYLWGWEKVQQIIDPDGEALTSTWSYYQPGETTGLGGSVEGVGKLKQYVGHDGREEFHTYWLNNHRTQLPFKDNAQGLVVLREYNPVTRTRTETRSVGANVLSKKSVTHDVANSRTIATTHTSSSGTLTTTTYYVPYGSDFGGQPLRIIHPDDTLTTYAYTRNVGGGKTVVESRGVATGNVVTLGLQTTTTSNRIGTVIRRITQGIGYSTGTAMYDHMAVTSVDDLGRPLVTAWFPTSSTVSGEVASATGAKWTTTAEYACCGLVKEVDRYGVETLHAYDGQRRRVKTHRLGVTIETAYMGNTTETHRYPETVSGSLSHVLAGSSLNLVGRQTQNVAGTLQESWAPDPSSGTAGALVKSTTAITYKPGAGLSQRTITTTPDDFSQTEDSFLDGRVSKTTGDLSPDMEYSYTVTASGLLSAGAYLDGANHREITGSQSDWAGRVVSAGYLPSLTSTTLEDAANNEYNGLGQLIETTDPDGVTTLYGYNGRGEQVVTAIDLNANGGINHGTDGVRSTETVPGLDGSDPIWITTSKVWESADTNPAAGTTVSIAKQSPDGLVSSSQQIGVTNPSTSVTALSGSGNWTETTTSPDGSYAVTAYVGGRLDVTRRYDEDDVLIGTQAIRSASNTAGSGYDTLGRVTHQRVEGKALVAPATTPAYVTVTAYVSTTADAVASVTDPGSRVTAFTYDNRGRRIAVDAPDTSDAANVNLTNITETTYFPDGNVEEVNGGQTYRVSHTYDYAGRKKTLTTYGTETAVTTWNYSATRGTLTSKVYPGGGGTDYTYTDAGRLLTRTWERGVVTTYGYDHGGRLVTTGYSDATPNVTIAYDALGRKTSETQTNRSVISYGYDSATLAVESETITYDFNGDGTGDFTRQIERTRDSKGREEVVQLKNGSSVENETVYGYDDAGRLHSVDGPAGTFTYSYADNDGRLIAGIAAPAHTVTNTWDFTRGLLTLKENKVGAANRSSYGYTVNAVGQRTAVSQTGTAFASTRSQAWGYNARGEVVKADSSITGHDRAYEYDGIGNRTKAADSLSLPGTNNYEVNALNQYTKVGTITTAYDGDGNATSYPVPKHLAANSTLVWDAENRLITATVNGTTSSYLYDAQGRRFAVTTGSITGIWIYDGWNPIGEYGRTGGGTPVLAKTYTWGLDLSGSPQGAGGVGGLLSVTEVSPTAHFYPTYDGNGNVTQYLNASGGVEARYEYDPFGRILTDGGDKKGDFAHRFSTKPLDGPTGLYYYGYRYYDPVTGRWPSRDPIEEEGGINLYGFVGNDGANRWDYLGYFGSKHDAIQAATEAVGKLAQESRQLGLSEVNASLASPPLIGHSGPMESRNAKLIPVIEGLNNLLIGVAGVEFASTVFWCPDSIGSCYDFTDPIRGEFPEDEEIRAGINGRVGIQGWPERCVAVAFLHSHTHVRIFVNVDGRISPGTPGVSNLGPANTGPSSRDLMFKDGKADNFVVHEHVGVFFHVPF